MLNQSLGWNDPRWQQMYPPRRAVDPALESIDGSENVEGLPAQPLPHYTEFLKAEAAANPAPPGIGINPGLAIDRPDLNANTLL